MGYLLPGLVSYVISKVCLTVVSASASPFICGPISFWEFTGPLFTVLVRRFDKMCNRGNLSLHTLSRAVSIKTLLSFDILSA